MMTKEWVFLCGRAQHGVRRRVGAEHRKGFYDAPRGLGSRMGNLIWARSTGRQMGSMGPEHVPSRGWSA